MSSALLKFQIGPVQDFIAQARSTRDLWSGSYLLSFLVAAGIRAIPNKDTALIFPNPDQQPLLKLPAVPPGSHQDLLTPNLPNIFIATVSAAKPEGLADQVKDAITQEWQRIATAVWDQRDKIGLPGSDETKKRFFAQVDRHLSISWTITPLSDDRAESYLKAYQHNGWHLDAVRQTRDFQAWDSMLGEGRERLMTEKDSLSGKEEALIAGDDVKGEWKFLFKHADYLGAVAIIKRVWHLAPLATTHKLKTSSREFLIRSIPAIAARKKTHVDDEPADEASGSENYIAAIAFDGDSIGRWVNGDFLPKNKASKLFPECELTVLQRFLLEAVRKLS